VTNQLGLKKWDGATNEMLLRLSDEQHVKIASMEQLEGLIAAGMVPNAGRLRKYGRNPVTADGDDIWTAAALGAAYTNKTFQEAPFTMYVASSQSADTSKRVIVTGIDGDGNLTQQPVLTDPTDGQTGVALTGTWLSSGRAEVLDAVVGNISIGKDEPVAGVHSGANMQAYVVAGRYQTELAMAATPAGYTTFLKHWCGGIRGTATSLAATLELYTKEPGRQWQIKSNLHVATLGKTSDLIHMCWEPIPASTLIKVICASRTQECDTWAEGFALYIKDEV
jgi:hypothetical protein